MANADFPKIEDHGALFNNRTAALVSKEGEVDWACFPNFDSEPVFFSILDRDVGGRFTIEPVGEGYTSSQIYEDRTNVLQTNFFYNGEVVMQLTDFLPMIGQPEATISDLHRKVTSFKDRLQVKVTFYPFDLRRDRKIQEFEGNGYKVESEDRTQTLSTDIKLDQDKFGVTGTFTLPKGKEAWFVSSNGVEESHHIKSFESEKRLEETVNYWRDWLYKGKYAGPLEEWVDRSLLVLKGLFFEPNYFMVASPTASLPEVTGGERNYDYRFMWVRDTAYVIDILSSFGYTDEALRFFYSMINEVQRDNGSVKSVYPISNQEVIVERTVELNGYNGSKPVRFGNEAVEQFQLDQYGSLINAIHVAHNFGAVITSDILDLVKNTARKLIEKWEDPDRSIWEIREEDKHYVYSKAVAWEALNNAAALLKDTATKEELDEILQTAGKIKETINRKGVDSTGKYYVQYFGSDLVDTAVLRLPLMGFCDVNDPIFKNTLEKLEERLLVTDFLFKRYETERGIDLSDNGFLLVSFWYIEDLFLMGNVRKAKEGLEKLLTFFNDLHLLPEEISLNEKKYLGNYPLALSHVGLMAAILRLSSGSFNVSSSLKNHNSSNADKTMKKS